MTVSRFLKVDRETFLRLVAKARIIERERRLSDWVFFIGAKHADLIEAVAFLDDQEIAHGIIRAPSGVFLEIPDLTAATVFWLCFGGAET